MDREIPRVMTIGNRDNWTDTLTAGAATVTYASLAKLEQAGFGAVARLPFSIKILLENLMRHRAPEGSGTLVTVEEVKRLAAWDPKRLPDREIPFMPGRVALQDFTGVPCVADLAAMRGAVKRMGGETGRVNPRIPVDLVIDHSVQVDEFGSAGAFRGNVGREYERNRERYTFLRWAQRGLAQFRVVPPGTGIVHQVNLEYLADVVACRDGVAFPDTLVGADSHTTMVNGLGVLGWGVGGIEAEACMLGEPLFIMIPQVVGFRLYGEFPEGATATDLVLTVTQMLRKHGVVGKFVEFLGPGVAGLSLPDRATVANMAPEYGATVGLFPIDEITLAYLRGTNRPPDQVLLVEAYAKAQGWFGSQDDVLYSDTLELDLGTVQPSLAGPRRPQDRIPLRDVKGSFAAALPTYLPGGFPPGRGGTAVAEKVEVRIEGRPAVLAHGSVVIAAITSCTNTSNPSVMVAAGLVARKAVERGLSVSPAVKTSLAPGSRVVTDYLTASGLMEPLERLGFHLVGYGCTTCIGNSGPLPEPVAEAIKEHNLVAAAVLSGNRNFEGRIHPAARMSYLASPPLVVAYAIAGTVNLDLAAEPIGVGKDGRPVFLREIWPSRDEITSATEQSLSPEIFRKRYGAVFEGDAAWRDLPIPSGDLYEWDPASTYILEPPFLEGISLSPSPRTDITGARVLALLGDSVTTDHISPAGSIPADSPAGRYLIERGVSPKEFNSYGSRRGNHEVMVRGTFGNIRLKNLLVAPKEGGSGIPSRWEGGWTIFFPTGEIMSIYDAAVKYREVKVPLVVLAGKEYGSGSSRDWAAKGTMLLGVRAVLAESYERIHRSNLVGMGVLPLEFLPGESAASLGLTGTETVAVEGIARDLVPGKRLTVRICNAARGGRTFEVIARLDSQVDVEYYRNGGILPAVLRRMLRR